MDIADVIAQVETGQKQYAQRFEQLHYKVSNPGLVARVVRVNDVSLNTADVYLAMSHGLFQIMGYELYGDKIAYQKPLWEFMISIAEQRAVFWKFLALDHLDHYTADTLRDDPAGRGIFARLYNGPANIPEYSQRIVDSIAFLDKQPSVVKPL